MNHALRKRREAGPAVERRDTTSAGASGGTGSGAGGRGGGLFERFSHGMFSGGR